MHFQNPPLSVLREKKLFIFDMDGTLFLGDHVFPEAVHLILHLRSIGKQILFFTNNASHNREVYMKRLTGMGFEPHPEEIMSAGDVTVSFLRKYRPGKKVYLLGTPELKKSFRCAGIPLISAKDTVADIVVSSLDSTMTYQKVCRACNLIAKGAEYFATHADLVCPVENGFVPDSGAISAMICAATGAAPEYFGKPSPRTVQMICESKGTAPAEMCFFGDRLYTDIAVGRRNGITSVLVLTGEAREEDLASAPADEIPDFIFPTLEPLDLAWFGSAGASVDGGTEAGSVNPIK